MKRRQNIYALQSRSFGFLPCVLRDYQRTQGLLPARAIAYNTLLFIVPLSILTFIVLSQYIEKGLLLHTLSTDREMMIPGYAAILTEQVRVFLEHGSAAAVIALLILEAIAVIILPGARIIAELERRNT